MSPEEAEMQKALNKGEKEQTEIDEVGMPLKSPKLRLTVDDLVHYGALRRILLTLR
jgi:hypothetical protein